MTDYNNELKEYFTNNRLPGLVANIILRIAGSSQNRFAAGQSKFSRSRIQEICRSDNDAPISFFIELIRFLKEDNPKLVSIDVVNDLVQRASDYFVEDQEKETTEKINNSTTNQKGTEMNNTNSNDRVLKDQLADKHLKEKEAEFERLRQENAELQTLVNDGRLNEVEKRLSMQSLAHQIDMLRRDMDNRVLTFQDIMRQEIELKVSKAKNGLVALISKTKDQLNERINREIKSIEETVNEWGDQTQETLRRIDDENRQGGGFDLSGLGSIAQAISPLLSGLKAGDQQSPIAAGLGDIPIAAAQPMVFNQQASNFRQPKPVSQPDKLYSLVEVSEIASKIGFDMPPEQLKEMLVENGLIDEDTDLSKIRLSSSHISEIVRAMGFNINSKQVEMVLANPEILSGFFGNMQFQNNPPSAADQQKPENQAE